MQVKFNSHDWSSSLTSIPCSLPKKNKKKERKATTSCNAPKYWLVKLLELRWNRVRDFDFFFSPSSYFYYRRRVVFRNFLEKWTKFERIKIPSSNEGGTNVIQICGERKKKNRKLTRSFHSKYIRRNFNMNKHLPLYQLKITIENWCDDKWNGVFRVFESLRKFL